MRLDGLESLLIFEPIEDENSCGEGHLGAVVESLAEAEASVGEGPMWDVEEQVLLWSDIAAGCLYRYDPQAGTNSVVYKGSNVGGFVLNAPGGILAFIWHGAILWKSDDECVRVCPETFEGDLLQFNDVIADPEGRVFAGTAPPEGEGKLYRFDPDGRVDVVADGVGLSNGLGFSPNLRTLYHTDSKLREIHAYDYARESGRIGNRRVFAKLDHCEGVPDGMTVDAEGFVWSATWFGSCIIRFDPDGKEERRLATPAPQTSSVMFGGRDLNELYFTSANEIVPLESGIVPRGYDYQNYLNGYRGGGLFRIKLDIQGREEYRANYPWPQ